MAVFDVKVVNLEPSNYPSGLLTDNYKGSFYSVGSDRKIYPGGMINPSGSSYPGWSIPIGTDNASEVGTIRDTITSTWAAAVHLRIENFEGFADGNYIVPMQFRQRTADQGGVLAPFEVRINFDETDGYGIYAWFPIPATGDVIIPPGEFLTGKDYYIRAASESVGGATRRFSVSIWEDELSGSPDFYSIDQDADWYGTFGADLEIAYLPGGFGSQKANGRMSGFEYFDIEALSDVDDASGYLTNWPDHTHTQSSGNGITYNVKPDGDDYADGSTYDTAWQTLPPNWFTEDFMQAGTSDYTDGDTLLISNCTLESGNLFVPDSGRLYTLNNVNVLPGDSEGNPILEYTDEYGIIWMLTEMTGSWTQEQGEVYSYDTPIDGHAVILEKIDSVGRIPTLLKKFNSTDYFPDGEPELIDDMASSNGEGGAFYTNSDGSGYVRTSDGLAPDVAGRSYWYGSDTKSLLFNATNSRIGSFKGIGNCRAYSNDGGFDLTPEESIGTQALYGTCEIIGLRSSHSAKHGVELTLGSINGQTANVYDVNVEGQLGWDTPGNGGGHSLVVYGNYYGGDPANINFIRPTCSGTLYLEQDETLTPTYDSNIISFYSHDQYPGTSGAFNFSITEADINATVGFTDAASIQASGGKIRSIYPSFGFSGDDASYWQYLRNRKISTEVETGTSKRVKFERILSVSESANQTLNGHWLFNHMTIDLRGLSGSSAWRETAAERSLLEVTNCVILMPEDEDLAFVRFVSNETEWAGGYGPSGWKNNLFIFPSSRNTTDGQYIAYYESDQEISANGKTISDLIADGIDDGTSAVVFSDDPKLSSSTTWLDSYVPENGSPLFDTPADGTLGLVPGWLPNAEEPPSSTRTKPYIDIGTVIYDGRILGKDVLLGVRNAKNLHKTESLRNLSLPSGYGVNGNPTYGDGQESSLNDLGTDTSSDGSLRYPTQRPSGPIIQDN